jgi:hypothetical protein
MEVECGQRQYKGWGPTPSFAAAGSLIPARIATTLLHERLQWVTIVLYPTASESWGVHPRAMLFWVLAALAVVGALAIDWGLYLLTRRWL